jgi:hypothetical protein
MDPSKFPFVTDLGGHIIDLCRLVDPKDNKWSATNASIGKHKNKYVVAIRSSNYLLTATGGLNVTVGDVVKSNVWWAELDKEFKLKHLRQIDISKLGALRRGIEDPKVFYRDNAWHFSFVVMEKGDFPYARFGIARLDSKCTKVVDYKIMAGMDAQRPEKNWMVPNEPSEHFDFIYGPNATVQNNLLTQIFTDNPKVSLLRGGSNLFALGDGTYLGVCHRTFTKNMTNWSANTFSQSTSAIRDYVHYFVKYDSQGMIIAVSEGFKFFRPGVEFAAGLTDHKDNFLISFGREDVSSHIAVLPKSMVFEMMVPVQY